MALSTGLLEVSPVLEGDWTAARWTAMRPESICCDLPDACICILLHALWDQLFVCRRPVKIRVKCKRMMRARCVCDWECAGWFRPIIPRFAVHNAVASLIASAAALRRQQAGASAPQCMSMQLARHHQRPAQLQKTRGIADRQDCPPGAWQPASFSQPTCPLQDRISMEHTKMAACSFAWPHKWSCVGQETSPMGIFLHGHDLSTKQMHSRTSQAYII